MSFTHLHVHTEYSLLDGACRVGAVAAAAKAKGMDALAVTDHGSMYGVIDFYRECRKAGVKPIIGCEVYVAARSRFDKVHGPDSERYHLILLAENNTGYSNLVKLVSDGWTDGFYVKPRVDRELLQKYHEGLICLSGCMMGEVQRKLQNGDFVQARKDALWHREVFGKDNYFLEMQDHGTAEDRRLNLLIQNLSEETGIPTVVTNDVHYIEKSDAEIQRILVCIQTNHTLGESTGMDFETDEFYLKTEEEMRSVFADHPQAVDNTSLIADRCNVEIEFGSTKLPNFDTPGGEDHFKYFSDMCYEGLRRRYGDDPPAACSERLRYELDVVEKMGYTDYYLIVHDFVAYAKKRGIPVGPGRGSGAGSIAAYCIGITGIDPMKYNLLFERFLNPERVSMPDFDIDFCDERRKEVIDYVISKYGEDHVSQIVTFGTLGARAAVRDVGRVMGLAYGTVDSVAGLIPFGINITLAAALEQSSELREKYENDSTVRSLIDNAMKVEGMPRHCSKHAAGVVITKDPVKEYVPLALSDEEVVTQYTMTALDALGLLKMDFLGLKTLTVIADAEKAVRKRQPDFDIEKIPLDDKNVYSLFSSGETAGIFQFESSGMKSVLVRLKPETLEDLIAVIALYRPGPMDSINTYIENRRHPERTRLKTSQLESILGVTHGVLIYQEQVMQVFRSLAGYSFGRADIVRRAMSKKKHDVMEKERTSFVEGCVQRGIDPKTADEIFNDMSSFASYAFNKSHAAAYSLVSYRTAYLKYYYRAEFMAALLSSVIDRNAKLCGYINECAKAGITVMRPDVNQSLADFTADGGRIIFGLPAIKNLGRSLINEIVRERETNGKYTSFYNFCSRIYGKNFNRRAVESLIYSGALDFTGLNRRQMIVMLPDVIQTLDADKNQLLGGQMSLFSIAGEEESRSPEPPKIAEFPRNEVLLKEKELLGFYVSGHPAGGYEDVSKNLGCAEIFDLSESDPSRDGEKVKILGIITSVKKKISRSGKEMAFVTIEDTGGEIEVLVFEREGENLSELIQVGNMLYVQGRLSVREEREPSVVADRVERCPEHVQPAAKERKEKKKILYLRFPDTDPSPQMKKVKLLLSLFSGGDTPVRFYSMRTGEYYPYDKGVEINEPLLHELSIILGEKNVVF